MELGWNESIVREKLPNLIVLDDLANRQHNTQLLVDQSIGRNEKSYFKLVPGCSILAGPKYALLREEFSLNTFQIVKNFDILINFGGADKDNFTMHVLNIIINSNLQNNLSIKVIIGKDYPFKSSLIKMIKRAQFNIFLVENPTKMAKEIGECKFAIGAGGVSLFERSSLSTFNTICYC